MAVKLCEANRHARTHFRSPVAARPPWARALLEPRLRLQRSRCAGLNVSVPAAFGMWRLVQDAARTQRCSRR